MEWKDGIDAHMLALPTFDVTYRFGTVRAYILHSVNNDDDSQRNFSAWKFSMMTNI